MRALETPLLTALTGLSASALPQDYWPLELVAAVAEAEEDGPRGATPLVPHEPPVLSLPFTAHEPDTQLLEEAQFITALQVSSPGGDFGGMREGEALLGIVQTDNTTESVWVWSHHRLLTGDAQFDQNLADAWTYILNHPAYLEEGGGGNLGYYRVYNSGWALIAEPAYRAATGDASFLPYARQCADYIVQNPLTFTSITPNLMVMTQAWAAGALYRFGAEQNDSAYRNFAVLQGDRVRQEAEADPLILARENWALSGGTILWGVLTSYFAQNPGARSWAVTWGPATDVIDDVGQWRIAHTAWYGLGRYAAWKASGDPQFLVTHRQVYDQLLTGDGDDDGGIPTTAYLATDEDETWVSNYMSYMAIERVNRPFDAAVASDQLLISPGDVWDLTMAVGNHSALEGLRYCLITGIEGPAGYSLGVLPKRQLALPALGVLSAPLPVGIPLDAPPGRYTAAIEVRTLSGVLADRDQVVVRVN